MPDPVRRERMGPRRFGFPHPELGFWSDDAAASLALVSRDADLDLPRRHRRVFLLAHKEDSVVLMSA